MSQGLLHVPIRHSGRVVPRLASDQSAAQHRTGRPIAHRNSDSGALSPVDRSHQWRVQAGADVTVLQPGYRRAAITESVEGPWHGIALHSCGAAPGAHACAPTVVPTQKPRVVGPDMSWIR